MIHRRKHLDDGFNLLLQRDRNTCPDIIPTVFTVGLDSITNHLCTVIDVNHIFGIIRVTPKFYRLPLYRLINHTINRAKRLHTIRMVVMIGAVIINGWESENKVFQAVLCIVMLHKFNGCVFRNYINSMVALIAEVIRHVRL